MTNTPQSAQCRTVAKLAEEVAGELEQRSRTLAPTDPRIRSLRREMRALAAILPGSNTGADLLAAADDDGDNFPV